MTPEDEADDALFAALAQEPPEDAGFSARVVARLPQRRTRRRGLLLFAVTVAGVLPAVFLPASPMPLPGPGLLASGLALAALAAMTWLFVDSGTTPRVHS